MKRSAAAHWTGRLKTGHGTLSSDSKVLSTTPYSFGTRFENGIGTNPEELIAAALAGCFTMALSGQLEKAGLVAQQLDTIATVSLEQSAAGFSIPSIHLQLTAHIPQAEQAAFDTAAQNAKSGCPVSKLLNAEITLDAKLIS